MSVHEPKESRVSGTGLINCTVTGKFQKSADVDVSWYRGNVTLREPIMGGEKARQSRLIQISDGIYRRILNVPNMAEKNRGTYECRVRASTHLESAMARTVHVANLITPTPSTKQDVTVPVTSFPHVLPTESVTDIQSRFTDVDLEGISTAEATSSFSAYVVVVPCLLIVLGLLCVLVGIWVIRRRERARATRLPPDDWEKIDESIEEEAFRVVVDKNHGWKTFQADNETVNQNQTQNEEVEKKEPSGGIEFPRSKLTLGRTLGNGHFGIVREAQAQYLHSAQATTTVAVKSVKGV